MTEYKLLIPTVEIVKDFAEQWKTENKMFDTFKDKYEDRIYIPENAKDLFEGNATNDEKLREVFDKYPDTNNENDVLFKMVLLDKLYSTQIKEPVKFAKKLAEKKVEISKDGEIDSKLVDEIANTGSRYEFSFASKYCHWHNAKYPIYDSHIVKLLAEYNEMDEHEFYDGATINYDSTKSKCSLKEYEYFYGAYEGFKGEFKLQECSVKEIDIFLWTYGKFLDEQKKQG